jgi:hypothetical protein
MFLQSFMRACVSSIVICKVSKVVMHRDHSMRVRHANHAQAMGGDLQPAFPVSGSIAQPKTLIDCQTQCSTGGARE